VRTINQAGHSAFHWNVAAVRLHERVIEAAVRWTPLGAASGGQALMDVIRLHAPVRPEVGKRLATNGDQDDLFAPSLLPVCQGCDRAELTPTRDALYPCRTTRVLSAILIGVADANAELLSLTAGASTPSGAPELHPPGRDYPDTQTVQQASQVSHDV
jgi:hypothetical protein